MKYEEIVKVIAPCGLNCGKCCAFLGGKIQKSAHSLAQELGDNFTVYADRFQSMNPIFKHYQAFNELLGFLAQASCSGCREKGCLFKACEVTVCAKNRKVDFCFQCDDFPCETHGFPKALAQMWQANNERMKAVGVQDYYNNIKDKPRYP